MMIQDPFTGRSKTIENSKTFGKTVFLLEYCDDDGGACCVCGKKLKRRWWIVVGKDGSDIGNLCLGCIGKIQ